MAESNGNVGLVARFLVSNRVLIYGGALIIMSVPLALAWLLDYVVSDALRIVIIAVSFAAIVGTYLAERQVKDVGTLSQPGPSDEPPISSRVQISLFLSIVGLAVGVYFLISQRYGLGLVFLAGAGLFYQLAMRSQDEEEGEE